MEHFTGTVALIGIVIVVASLMSGLVERMRLPVVALFLALGAAIGPMGLGLVDVRLDSPSLATMATLGLAMVLFQDALTISLRDLRTHRNLLWRVLGPGTLIPGAIIALAAWWLLGLSMPAAAILGAALASTDPVLLRSVLRSDALPPASRIALRIESGMNDVVLLPVVVIAMLALQSGGPGGHGVVRSLAGLLMLGPAAGVAVGWLGITLLVRIRGSLGVRRDYESLYALGLAFSAYAAAEALGGSGFLAAFSAGLVISFKDVELCDCFREYGEATAEMLLLLTFVALGTRVIWDGLDVIGWRTLAVAAIALGVRTAILYPVLAPAGVPPRERRLIALFGPRGLSSLLLTLLPVFAGIAGAEELFTIACLVVLFSVVLHGGSVAFFLRREARMAGSRTSVPLPTIESTPAEQPAAEKITMEEFRALRERGDPFVVIDARADRSWDEGDLTAAGSTRLDPDDPVRDARAQRLSQRATLVVYCA